MNDIYIWKTEKGDKGQQQSFSLKTSSKETLQTCLNHCNSMLYNTNREYPGRTIVLQTIQEQIKKANIAIYIKAKRKEEPISNIIEALSKQNPETKLSEILSVHAEFADLTVNDVLDGALERLGLFNKKYITLNNLLWKKGIKITNEEYNSLFKMYNSEDILNYYKQKLFIDKDIKLRLNRNGLLFADIQSILEIKSNKYEELTTQQLKLLRDVILPDLVREINKQINFWQVKANLITYIQKDKGYI